MAPYNYRDTSEWQATAPDQNNNKSSEHQQISQTSADIGAATKSASMAPYNYRDTSEWQATAPDRKMNQLLQDVTVPVLKTYLDQLIRDDTATTSSGRDKALTLLGMIVYKANPPRTISNNALEEYVPLLRLAVKDCQLHQREDLKTPATKTVWTGAALIHDEFDEMDQWEDVALTEKHGSIPEKSDRKWAIEFNDKHHAPVVAIPTSASTSRFERGTLVNTKEGGDAKSFETVSLGSRRTLDSWDYPMSSLEKAVSEAPERVPKQRFIAPKIIPTSRDDGWFGIGKAFENAIISTGTQALKSVAKVLPFDLTTPYEESPGIISITAEKDFQGILSSLEAIADIEGRIKTIIGGYGSQQQRDHAVLILGMIFFLYGHNKPCPAGGPKPAISECVALYSYIPMMQMFVYQNFYMRR